MTNRQRLKEIVREHEGLKLEAYPGPKTGLLHIGYGHLLGQAQSETELEIMGLEDELDDWTGFTIDEDQAEALLETDIQDAIESLAPTWTAEELDALDAERFIALLSMAFQLGGFGVQRKFPSFVKAVKSEDWDRAADEMVWSNGLKKQNRSQWYKDTPHRCQEMADKMRYGSGSTPPVVDAPTPGEIADISTEALIEELGRRITGKKL